jgi:hypothetical protein
MEADWHGKLELPIMAFPSWSLGTSNKHSFTGIELKPDAVALQEFVR